MSPAQYHADGQNALRLNEWDWSRYKVPERAARRAYPPVCIDEQQGTDGEREGEGEWTMDGGGGGGVIPNAKILNRPVMPGPVF
jgi:hypothetical protein